MQHMTTQARLRTRRGAADYSQWSIEELWQLASQLRVRAPAARAAASSSIFLPCRRNRRSARKPALDVEDVIGQGVVVIVIHVACDDEAFRAVVAELARASARYVRAASRLGPRRSRPQRGARRRGVRHLSAQRGDVATLRSTATWRRRAPRSWCSARAPSRRRISRISASSTSSTPTSPPASSQPPCAPRIGTAATRSTDRRPLSRPAATRRRPAPRGRACSLPTPLAATQTRREPRDLAIGTLAASDRRSRTARAPPTMHARADRRASCAAAPGRRDARRLRAR